jgi:transmembrane sensor
MKPYHNYTAEDLACDEDFLNWIKHPHRHTHLESFWNQWLVEHPERLEVVEEARYLVLTVLTEDQFFPDNIKQKNVWSRIQRSTDERSSKKIATLSQQWYSRAAILAMCLSLGWWTIDHDDDRTITEQVQRPGVQFVKHVNNTESPQAIILGDGTSITLQPHGVLEYPERFAADRREVSLTGEAFFEVTRDATRPFLVEAGDVITRVLGTSFTVRNIDEEANVLVQVKTGKVSVFLEEEKTRPSGADKNVQGVVLTPNQQVLYEKSAMKMTKSLVENPSVLVPPHGETFVFIDTPIKEVFGAIEEAYGVDIVFDDEALSGCYLNASLDDIAMHDKLRLICKAINASYEVMDSHIIVYGKGCDQNTETQNPTTL